MRIYASIACLIVLAIHSPTYAQEAKKDLPIISVIDLKRKEPIDYSKDVETIFANKCFVCHSGSIIEGKFDMSTHAGVMKGGKRGVDVIPGKSAESNLFLFCSRQKKPIMPPKSEDPLTPEELTIIKLWIDQGCHRSGDGSSESQNCCQLTAGVGEAGSCSQCLAGWQICRRQSR